MEAQNLSHATGAPSTPALYHGTFELRDAVGVAPGPPTDAGRTARCPHCQAFFKPRGLNNHIRCAHPDAARARVAKNHDSSSNNVNSANTNKDDVSASKTADVNMMEEWEDSLYSFLNKVRLNQQLHDQLTSALDVITNDLILFLYNAADKLSGPVHPAVKHYQARRQRIHTNSNRTHKMSNNPRRLAGRDKDRSKQKYSYDLAQYNYYNQRKKVVKQIMSSDKTPSCKIPIPLIEEHFKEIFGNANERIAEEYVDTTRNNIDAGPYSTTVTQAEVNTAISGISIDSAPGSDRVLVRVLRELKCAKTIGLLATAIGELNYVPEKLRDGRLLLLHKGGDDNIISNWRPLTIFSVVRRVIERVFDKRLRSYVRFSVHQRGFVSTPGTHINASLINGCLQDAKTKKLDCSVVFLDVSKAFDNIGHSHIKACLSNLPIPEALRETILTLTCHNSVQIEVNRSKSKRIQIRRGVPQGAPMSPTLFNLAIDHIIKGLTEKSVSDEYGYSLIEELENLSAVGFADDIALIGNNGRSASELASMAERGLRELGLTVNTSKSSAINIINGTLSPEPIITSDASAISSIGDNERIRYLGIDFNSSIVINKSKIIQDLRHDICKLTTSDLLKPDQKLNILNQFVWPKLIYPLQCAPIPLLTTKFLEDIDIIMRSAVKEIIGIPGDTPTSFIYAPRKFRGLGIMRATWEAHVQHFNICKKLLAVDDPLIAAVRDLPAEKAKCVADLGLSIDPGDKRTSGRTLRDALRLASFNNWAKLPQKGKGVGMYAETPRSNKWVYAKNGLSSSEWTNSIKMSCNVAAVRAVPGRSTNTNRCRTSDCNEIETIAHVLGRCNKGELLRNTRHHTVRTIIADAFRNQRRWEVHEEISCISTDGSTRRVDIVAIRNDRKQALILDPTIRFEQGANHAEEVNEEKKKIYEPCIEDLSKRYKIPVDKWEVVGLLVGARAAIPSFFTTFLKRFTIPLSILDAIVPSVLKSSISILHNHLYCNNT